MEKLNRSKGTVKAAITKLEAFLTEISDNSATNVSQVEVKLKKTESLQVKLEQIREQYYDIPDLQALQLQEIESDIDSANDRLENIEVRLKLLLTSFKFESNTVSINETSNEIKPKIRLPEIPLPVFSGAYCEFANFKIQFTNLIVNNDQLDSSQKLFYLKASLKGEAKHLESADDTFDSLFQALIHRYENKRLLIDCHISSILNYDKIQHESAKELRTFVDCINKNIRALKVLEYNQNNLSEVLFVNIILQKLDRETQKQFELSIETTNVPTFDFLISFLEKRCAILESVSRSALQTKTQKVLKPNYVANKSKAFVLNSNKNNNMKHCIFCKQSHPLFRCIAFQNISIHDRKEFVNKNKLCKNCLRLHTGQCNSNLKCQLCRQFHNSLLCETNINKCSESRSINESESQKEKKLIISDLQNSQTSQAPGASLLAHDGNDCAILNTAIVLIKDAKGRKISLRTIVDSASTINILTENASKILDLPLTSFKGSVTGINGYNQRIKHIVKAKIYNQQETFSRNVEFSVLPKITNFIPATKLDISKMSIPNHIELADSNFHVPAQVDALIGSELFFDILKGEQIRLENGKCILQNTELGYLVTGSLPQVNQKSYCCLLHESNLDKTLKRFFEVESFPGDKDEFIKGEEEIFCEEHFKNTYRRDDTGRFIVQLPMRKNAESVLGSSKEIAVKRLNSLWAKLDKNKVMANLYTDFLEEYEYLGHMKEVKIENTEKVTYFIPHHAVYKPEKTSTPLRVVFNASSNTSTGHSLNSILLNGGTIQQDLFTIVTRFRKHKYAFCADIKKMYRQILVDPSQRNLQKIVWKSSRDAPIKIFDLCTVTYGTVCAPFLATRTLKALAEEERNCFPLAAEVICTDMYMDDCLSGASSLEKAQELQSQLIQILQKGGMELHKWVSNHSELLQDKILSEYTFDENSQQIPVKTLGMFWKPQIDHFIFKINIQTKDTYSKREVLSEIAKIYDPLGLIGPILTKAKIFMQGLWQLKLDWNDRIPSNALREWEDFLLKLTKLNDINIPRYVLTDNIGRLELHGFADASSKAYGAAIYIRCLSKDEHYISHLLCSKSRVAPLKPVTIPRLELLAALLLTRLVKRLIPALQLCFEKIWLWTDSSIVLSWLRTPPHKLKTFVANRVTEIQTLSNNCCWSHVSSKDNPADIISRGAHAKDLLNNNLWWFGPDFLQQPNLVPRDFPAPTDEDYENELKHDLTLVITDTVDFFEKLYNCTNSFMKLIRICSYICRFINNARHKGTQCKYLTSRELQVSIELLVKNAQEGKFASEIAALRKGQNVPSSSKLKALDPFLDKNSLLRVGGRLHNSNLPFDAKHQLILPNDHKLSNSIFEYFHTKYLHIGAQGLVHQVRMQYWPIKAKSMARKIVHSCVTCFRHKPKTLDQLMGNLPPDRVTPNSAFINSGVDFCGPFHIKYRNQRKGIYSKVYVAIFICMATKAIHLELVSDLSAAAFIAALKRFCARRGKILTLTSDNATNFKGTSAELNKFKKLLNAPDEDLANFFADEFIKWKFIPPRSPNFGGLWEAGVKSFKHHLHRALGNNKLTLEDFETLIIQIEGILNSRPLFPLSDDINEFEVLTPGHFLVGRPICGIPEPDVINISDNRLTHWQRITKYVQCIWKRWSIDYLNHLQQRGKWQFKKENIKLGALVLLKEENLPPCKWALAKIIEIIPGTDGKIRACKLKTPSGIFLRSISKLCLLPIQDNEHCNVF